MKHSLTCVIRYGLVPLLLVALTAVIYSNSLQCSWQFDDYRSILEFDYANATLRSIFSFSPQRSLVFLSFWVNYLACGYSLSGWHLVNIIIHALNVLLLYGIAARVLQRALCSPPGAYVARYTWTAAAVIAALFAAHPLQTQAVTYIVQRLELIGTLWVFCAVYAALRSFDAFTPFSRRGWAAGVTCALAAGALSKEIIVVAPLLIALYFILIHARTWRARWIALFWCSAIALVLTGLILLGFRALTFTPWPTLSFAPFTSLWREYSSATYYPQQPRVMLLFLRLCLLPYKLRVEYVLDPGSGWGDPRTLAALSFHLLLITGAALLWRRHPVVLFGLLWFYVFLLPSLVMPNGIFEHRAYGALAGILLALTGLFTGQLRRLPAALRRPAAAIGLTVAACVLISFATLTYLRNIVWSSELSLWLDTVSKSPTSWRANANAGRALMDYGDYEDARPYLEKAFALNSNVYLVASNLGVLYFNLQQYKRSAELFSYALSLKPNAPLLLYYLGAATVRLGDFHTGTNLLHRANLPAAWTALGDVHYERNEFRQALSCYQRTLDYRTNDLDALAGKLRTLLALTPTNVTPSHITPSHLP
ncbi:MAG: tetratricopeptide repeat protein [bacterium]|nr:tetratricopeptide repeat protein [bacterium]